ncbi:MAG: hypothetical protein ACYDHN_11365 [Solirubrobacteraceae bacterium]
MAVLVLGCCASGCGSDRGASHARGAAPALEATGPAFGLTEDNANLLTAPAVPGGGSSAFLQARRELTALHPTYLRLLVDWAALQPERDRPADLEARIDGCARGVRPCGVYAGLRAELSAIASQQRAAGSRHDFRVVIDVFGTPTWAAAPPSGCELPGTAPFSRPLTAAALERYRTLIRSLLRLAAAEGVALEWWSPWNEPNDPRFISPQRSGCAADSPALSPLVYAQLARAMAAELRADGGTHRLVLGELNDFEVGSAHTTSVSEFIAALPADVLCLDGVWSIHAYARYGADVPPSEPVHEIEDALDARGDCGRDATVWVTEAGAGAPHPGQGRAEDEAQEREGCMALADQLHGWLKDPRVGAIFQYTFREDPDFPVGLVSADLAHRLPSYGLWLQWTRSRTPGSPPPSAADCA